MSRVERSNAPHDDTPHDEANCPSCQADIAAMTEPNNDELQAALRTSTAALAAATKRIFALTARCEALEKDAARYRWLRNGNDSSVLHQPACEIAEGLSGHEWDKAIDTAMGFAAADAERP